MLMPKHPLLWHARQSFCSMHTVRADSGKLSSLRKASLWQKASSTGIASVYKAQAASQRKLMFLRPELHLVKTIPRQKARRRTSKLKTSRRTFERERWLQKQLLDHPQHLQLERLHRGLC